jgi:hypothetical protein
MTNVKLNSKTDYTPTQLKAYLNKKYGGKITGKPFTNQDIFMYTKRGYLPPIYSGTKIEVMQTNGIGIRILRVIFE